jgi:hypothetical protein
MKLKRDTKDALKLGGIVIAVVAFFAIGIYYEMAVWQECRQTNSWFYCMRVLSK